MNQVLTTFKVVKVEKKTFIGRTNKGYDWLGYRIEPEESALNAELSVADIPPTHTPFNETNPKIDNRHDLTATVDRKKVCIDCR